MAEPTAGYALSATPSSAAHAGVAAELRAARKCSKYCDLAAGVSSDFRPACIERFGAMCGALLGLIKSMVGDRERDAFFDDAICLFHVERHHARCVQDHVRDVHGGCGYGGTGH